ncbi:MAG: (d)CMP kinase, partial [Proteobacteria bacterium]|nr:(d)CMP kinase [Pseudomonadota bacterium]
AKAAAALVPADLEDPGLRSEAAGQAASKVAAHPKVRAALLAFQRGFAANPPAGAAGAVVDGRDIGTVVLPEADFKLFVFASEEERARRRWAELAAAGDAPDPDKVLAAMRERDRRDAGRTVSPLKPAAGCYLLDTTDLDIDAAFAAAKAYISGPI